MNQVGSLHTRAMDSLDKAIAARRAGNEKRARMMLKKAFGLEREAASLIADQPELEPTRSILHRSAANLALQVGEIRDAEKLIAEALSGDPPDGLAEELRDLLEDVHATRHLAVRGVTLLPDEVQIGLVGRGVGAGFAESGELIDRVQAFERLYFRTSERRARQPYRERGRPVLKTADDFGVFISIPRPGSFSVSLKFGAREQVEMVGMSDAEATVDDLFDSLKLFEENKPKELHKKIRNEAYYRNFVALAAALGPDGESVRKVNLTVRRERDLSHVTLTKQREEHRVFVAEKPNQPSKKRIVLIGTLLYADAVGKQSGSSGAIKLVDSKGRSRKIEIPLGLLDDIVRPLWDREVRVVAFEEGGKVVLESVKPA